MRSLKFFAILFILFPVTEIYAADPMWHQGSLILKSEEVIAGEISYEKDHDVVLYRKGKELVVYPAHKIQSFYFYDDESKVNRKFISLQQTIGAFTTHQLYELVIYGEVSIVRRERLIPYSIHHEVIDYEYFIRKDDELLRLRKFKRHIYPQLLFTYEEKLMNFIHQNKLNLTRSSHVIRIVEYYNGLVSQEHTLAKH
jgi:hypothetical protein